MISYTATDFEEYVPVVNWAYPDDYIKRVHPHERSTITKRDNKI